MTPSQRHKAKQEALGRKSRLMWTTIDEHQFARKAVFAYRECGNGKSAMEKLLTDMNKEGQS